MKWGLVLAGLGDLARPADKLSVSQNTALAVTGMIWVRSLVSLIELAVVIGKNGRDISVRDSDSHIGGYALAIDMTARNMQEKAKKSGLPWSAAKGFDTFTPISDLIAKDQIPDPHNVDLWLQVNNEMRQSGNTKDMIFSIPELIAYVSSIMTLETGDVLLTGTPKGVSQIQDGDKVLAGLRNAGSPTTLAELRLLVKNRVGSFAFRG
ncbi:acylpyruvate hydrolase [Malassezia caprae]|uniref:Mitochondrial pyruvate carrier n=1 Tax=Malassezia caprae TaxID=1381934 RepID=A0AAF0E9B5_9BASI|nr:acylpyruvate hydrolase [Malassezia caprae]